MGEGEMNRYQNSGSDGMEIVSKKYIKKGEGYKYL